MSKSWKEIYDKLPDEQKELIQLKISIESNLIELSNKEKVELPEKDDYISYLHNYAKLINAKLIITYVLSDNTEVVLTNKPQKDE